MLPVSAVSGHCHHSVDQRFPNFLGYGPFLLLNIFRGPPDNTKDI